MKKNLCHKLTHYLPIIGLFILLSTLFAQAQPASAPARPWKQAKKDTALMKSFYLIDMHCHPSLKVYLFNKHIWRHHIPTWGVDPARLQVDTRHMKRGNVRGILLANHLPEAGLLRGPQAIHHFLPVFKALLPDLVAKFSNNDSTNFDQINEMIDDYEWQVERARQKGTPIDMARNIAAFDSLIAHDSIAVANAIEGAHALGVGMSSTDPGPYIRRLDFLIKRGLCLMTLSHFFHNDIADPVEGISPDAKYGMRWFWRFDPQVNDYTLSPIGYAVVCEMLKQGVIVDVTHVTPAGRAEVFHINDSLFRKTGVLRPIVFSHTGVRELFKPNSVNHNYGYYSPDSVEIMKIDSCHGVIGIIPENFWLVGSDPHLKKYHPFPGYRKRDFRKSIPNMVAAMQKICDYTCTYDDVAIGTDLDGYAEDPHDFFSHAQMKNLIKAMYNSGIPPKDISNILNGNATRVLHAGWH